MNHAAAPTRPPRSDAYVHVRVGRCDIAIPIAQVWQALPLPPHGLTALPRRTGALLGLAETADAALPVVALERWLPLTPDADPTQQRLLVLQHDGARVAVQVDAVLGVKTVAQGAVRRLQHGDDAQELFEAVVPAGADNPTLCLLEVARLMRLSQSWCAEAELAPEAAGVPLQAPGASAAGGSAERHAVFQIGTELWAVPVAAVGRVVPVPAAELDLRRGERSWALSQWQGRKLPLVDISAGSQASSHAQAPWMVLMSQGPLLLGLTVSACRQFVDLAADAVAPTPGDALTAGLSLHPELGKLQVLDPAKLFRLTPEAAVGQGGRAAGAAQTAAAEPTEPTPYLVFEADQPYATPVTGIVGVVELPEPTRADLLAGARAVMPWRNQTLHVVKLPAIAGPAAASDPRLAVLVQPDDQGPPVGIAVTRLCDWLPAHTAQRSGVRMGSMGELCLIHAKGSASTASLVVVDLAQMAHLLG